MSHEQIAEHHFEAPRVTEIHRHAQGSPEAFNELVIQRSKKAAELATRQEIRVTYLNEAAENIAVMNKAQSQELNRHAAESSHVRMN